jgi:hypothetical protein
MKRLYSWEQSAPTTFISDLEQKEQTRKSSQVLKLIFFIKFNLLRLKEEDSKDTWLLLLIVVLQ